MSRKYGTDYLINAVLLMLFFLLMATVVYVVFHTGPQ